jgi:hypothetical protein
VNRNLRQAFQALERIEASGFGDPFILAHLRKVMEEMARKRPRVKQALPGPSRAEKREAKRARHREETAAIREAVFKRAGDRCEHTVPILLTGAILRCIRPPSELHHLEMGNGRRRQRQTVENCRAYCFECHCAAHRASKRPSPPLGDAP